MCFRVFTTISALFLTVPVAVSQKPVQLEVALTFDDLPATGAKPTDITREQIIRSILDTLKLQHIPPVYGFVNASGLEGEPRMMNSVLTAWRDAGNYLGSHTWSHADLERVSVADFEKEILDNEPALQHYAGASDWHWFRYPFLHEGETLEKRQAIENFLRDHHYRVAEVSLDFEDTMYNAPYARCMDKQRTTSVAAMRDSYLAVADEYTDIFRSLAHTLYGRDIPYVVLLHVGAATAYVLPDFIAQLRSRGFTFVTLPAAMKDPAYGIDPAIGYPGGGALQEMLLAARKLPFPPNAKPNDALDHMCQK
jgi:peptidoglycan/xylan/chitin deacetylase (PgdA/CDA1 family)